MKWPFNNELAERVALEVRRGYGNKGYSATRVELGSMPSKEIASLLNRHLLGNPPMQYQECCSTG